MSRTPRKSLTPAMLCSMRTRTLGMRRLASLPSGASPPPLGPSLRLQGRDAFGLTALKAGVLPGLRAFGEGQALPVGEPPVAPPALAGGAQLLGLAGAPLGDGVVLDGMPLLLAAVEPPLPLGAPRALDGALHSVDDELESPAPARHRLKVAGLAAGSCLSWPSAALRTGVSR